MKFELGHTPSYLSYSSIKLPYLIKFIEKNHKHYAARTRSRHESQNTHTLVLVETKIGLICYYSIHLFRHATT